MKQVVLFHCEVTIGDFTFKSGKMYILEIKGQLPHRHLYYQDQNLANLNRFQNEYVDRHYTEWIDDPELAKQVLAA